MNFVPSTKRNHYSMRNRNAKEVSFDDLRRLFHLPISEVSERVGICTTLLKKMCRKNSLKRWPFRKIRSLIKTIGSLQESYNSSVSEEDRAAFEGRIKDTKNQLHEYFGTSVTNEEMDDIISQCLKEQDEENKKNLRGGGGNNNNNLYNNNNRGDPYQLPSSSGGGDLFPFATDPLNPNQSSNNSNNNNSASTADQVLAAINFLSPYSNYPLFSTNNNNNSLLSSTSASSSLFSPTSNSNLFSNMSPNIKTESIFNNNNNNTNNNNNNNNNTGILSVPSSGINSCCSSSGSGSGSSCVNNNNNNMILDTTNTNCNNNIISSSSSCISPPPPPPPSPPSLLSSHITNTTTITTTNNINNNPPSLSKSDIFTLSSSTPLPSLTSLDNTLTNTEQSNSSAGSTNSIPPQLVGLDVNTGTPSFNSMTDPPFSSLSLTSPSFNILTPPSPFENYTNNNNNNNNLSNINVNGNPRKRAKIEIPTPNKSNNNSNIFNNNNYMNSMLMSPSILTPTAIEPYSIYAEDSDKEIHAVPYENIITYTILTMLDCTDIHNFGLTCKDNYKFVQQDSIWEYMVKSRYKRSSKWHFNGNWEKLYHQITGRCKNPYPIPKCLYGCTFVFNNCSSAEYETMIIKLGGTISKSGTMLMDNNITQKFVLVSDKSFQPYANIMPTESPGTPIYLTLPQFKALVDSRYSKFLQN